MRPCGPRDLWQGLERLLRGAVLGDQAIEGGRPDAAETQEAESG